MIEKTQISIIGCGWLGYPLALFLQKKGWTICGSSRSDEKLRLLEQHKIRPFKINVSDRLHGDYKGFFKSEILIINIPPGRRNPEVVKDHTRQIQAIIQAAKEGKVEKILFVSSTGVYGNENRVMTEVDKLNPVRKSGIALEIIEKSLLKQKTFQTTIVRMAGLVGGERKAGRFLAGKKDIANGGAPINMVHRDDCIAVIYEIIRQEKWGDIFNVCADKHPSRKDFYTAQALKDGFEPPHFADEGTGDYKIISNEKVKRVLDYTFQYPDPMQFP